MSEIGVSTMEWPGNSPDLNPIENLWYILKVQVGQKRPQTIRELDQCIQKVWYEEISKQTLANLIASMPNRIKEVIKQKGGTTKY